MPRFFVSPDAIGADSLFILGDDAFHIARALRMAVGDSLTVTDGAGTDYQCRLTYIRDDRCDCEILGSVPSSTEPKIPITLYMAYPKGDKLEIVVQKAVELGASRIVPFESSRCIKRPAADRAEKIGQRLTRIAEEAAKQCGRSRLPTVERTLSYSAMLAEAKSAGLPLFCYEDEKKTSIKDVLNQYPAPASVAVVVGSEGGFSPEEAEQAKAAGLLPVCLGPRILRCETAPDYALSAISFFYELKNDNR